MVCSTVMALALAADPTWSVVVAKRVNVTPEKATAVATALEAALTRKGLTPMLPVAEAVRRAQQLGLADTAACLGKRACLGELATQLSLAYVVTVSVTSIGSDTSIAFELLDIAARAAAEHESLVLSNRVTPTAEELAPFVKRVHARLAKPVAPKPTAAADAPVEISLAPSGWVERADGPELEIVSSGPTPHAASWVLGAGALAALGASVALVAVAGATHASLRGTEELPGGYVGSTLTGSEAQGVAAAATTQLGIGIGLAALGVGLGTGAVLTW
ncbi:MAG: hypothetical protein JNG84_02375 [Archangium sp.]|nr:hypothetical protein [Archangium sp.]